MGREAGPDVCQYAFGHAADRAYFEIRVAGQRFHRRAERAGGGVTCQFDRQHHGNAQRDGEMISEVRRGSRKQGEASGGRRCGDAACSGGDLLDAAVAHAAPWYRQSAAASALCVAMRTAATSLAAMRRSRVEDQVAGGAVEISGGLVGQQQGGRVHHGARDGHALHLRRRKADAAYARRKFADFDPVQVLRAPFAGVADAREQQRQLHVFDTESVCSS